jgi:hypothetical protein
MVTLFVTDDPQIGDYVTNAVSGAGRTLDNAATCPRDITGLPHPDSLPLSGALYEARRLVAGSGAERAAFDAAVFAAQQALGADADFGTAAALTEMELDLALGPDAADAAARVFDERGVSDCARRVLDATGGKAFHRMPGDFREDGAAFSVPGPFQFRYQLEQRAASIAVDIGVYDVFVTDPALIGASIAIRAGDQPIRWVAEDDSFRGDFDASEPLALAEDRSARGVLTGPFEPGIYHLQVINHGVDAQLRNLTLSHDPIAGGCGCASADRRPAASALLLALATLLATARAGLRAGRPRQQAGSTTGPGRPRTRRG